MLSPIDCAPDSLAPRLAASMIPGPPPVMIAKPASPSSRAVSRASAYSGWSARRARRAEHRHRGAHVAQRLEARPQLVEHPLDAVLVGELRDDVRLLGGDDLLVEGARVRAARRSAIGGLERERQGLLQQLPHAGEELRAVGAVEDAVVADERERHLVAGHHPAALVHRRLLLRARPR